MSYRLIKKTNKENVVHKGVRRKLFLDEQRIWSVTLSSPSKPSENKFTVRSIMLAYFWNDLFPKSFFNTRSPAQVKDFMNLSKRDKNVRYYSEWQVRQNAGGTFYRTVQSTWTALHAILSTQTVFLEAKVDHLLVFKFFHETASENIFWKLKFVRKVELQPNTFTENGNIGRALYLYKSESSTNAHLLYPNNLDWPFPDKYSEKIGLPVTGFEFVSPNLEDSLKKIIEPSQSLINYHYHCSNPRDFLL